MKITDKERIQILRKVKRNIREGAQTCICPALDDYLNTKGKTYRNVRKIFPELKKYKPKNTDIEKRWFPANNNRRFEVLDLMITDIKAKSK